MRRARAALPGLLIVLGIVVLAGVLWEGYKALGQATGDVWPGTSIALPVATDDYAMPHLLDIAHALGEPISGSSGMSLLTYLLIETSVTVREAAYGVLFGGAIGFVAAVALREARFLNRGVMPWLVASQTIPLVALAPIIVIWVGQQGYPSWIAVTVIAAYLSFFPVTVSTLKGLNAVDPIHDELMASLASPRWYTVLRLRIPTALPHIFTGLRLAATASVVGAVVGELAAGTGRGIGRAIFTASYFFSNAPETLFAAVLIASLAGIVFVQIVSLTEALVLRNRS
ncbi:ABC transporter permease subunit, partial [Georgenia sp. 10Sc9-8]|nr:ABC transporter permease subunit [Georgenia halotolerans]